MREDGDQHESNDDDQEMSEAPTGTAFHALPEAVSNRFSESHEQLLLYGYSAFSA